MIIYVDGKIYDSGTDCIKVVMTPKEKDVVSESNFSTDTFIHFPTNIKQAEKVKFEKASQKKISEYLSGE